MASDTQKNRAASKRERSAIRSGLRIQRDTLGEVTRLLRIARQSVINAINAQPTDYGQWILPQILQSVNQAMNELGDQASGIVGQAASRAWENGIDQVDGPLQAGGLRVDGIAPIVDTRKLMAMRSFMTDRVVNISMQAKGRINAEMGLVSIGSQSSTEAIRNVSQILNVGGRKRAKTIIRTELARVTSVAKQERQEQLVKQGLKIRKKWRRSGKIHPRQDHVNADGQIQDIGDPFVIHAPSGIVKLMFPRDPQGPPGETINCGCHSITVVEDWEPQFPGRLPFTNLEISAGVRVT